MRYDPGWAVVSSLEVFDEATGQARKAEIFSTDLVSKRTELLSASGPEEALAMSLDRARRVDLDLIAGLLDVDAATARDLLRGLVYPDLDDPTSWYPPRRRCRATCAKSWPTRPRPPAPTPSMGTT